MRPDCIYKKSVTPLCPFNYTVKFATSRREISVTGFLVGQPVSARSMLKFLPRDSPRIYCADSSMCVFIAVNAFPGGTRPSVPPDSNYPVMKLLRWKIRKINRRHMPACFAFGFIGWVQSLGNLWYSDDIETWYGFRGFWDCFGASGRVEEFWLRNVVLGRWF